MHATVQPCIRPKEARKVCFFLTISSYFLYKNSNLQFVQTLSFFWQFHENPNLHLHSNPIIFLPISFIVSYKFKSTVRPNLIFFLTISWESKSTLAFQPYYFSSYFLYSLIQFQTYSLSKPHLFSDNFIRIQIYICIPTPILFSLFPL